MLGPRAVGRHTSAADDKTPVAFTATRWGTLLEPHADSTGPPPTAFDCHRYWLAQPAVQVPLTVPPSLAELEQNLDVRYCPDFANVSDARSPNPGSSLFAGRSCEPTSRVTFAIQTCVRHATTNQRRSVRVNYGRASRGRATLQYMTQALAPGVRTPRLRLSASPGHLPGRRQFGRRPGRGHAAETQHAGILPPQGLK
jgi:hypothetical protein